MMLNSATASSHSLEWLGGRVRRGTPTSPAVDRSASLLRCACQGSHLEMLREAPGRQQRVEALNE